MLPHNLYTSGSFGLKQAALLREALQASCSQSHLGSPRLKHTGLWWLLGELEGTEFRD